MNYVLLFIEVLLVFLLMVIFYKLSKKDALYLYIGLLASLAGISIIGSIEIMSFDINMGLPIIMGLFVANNIIIHRYGLDEVKRILYTFGICYFLPIIFIQLGSLINKYGLDVSSNGIYDLLFGYDLDNLRVVVGGFISIFIMIWMSSGIYYSIRKNRSAIVISNLTSAFVVSFIESMVFVLITNIGYFGFIELFGMISIRYIIEIIISIIGLVPVYYLIKYVDK